MGKKKQFYIERTELITMVESLQRSEPNSVEILRDAFRDKIYGHIMRRVKNDKKVADIVLDNVFSEIFGSINTLREPAAFVKWSNRITENQIAAYYRTNRKRIKAEKAYYENLKNEVSDAQKDRAIIAAHISMLSPKHSEVVQLHVIKGIPVKEIAERLNIPEGTVKSRLYYARKNLEKERENQKVNK